MLTPTALLIIAAVVLAMARGAEVRLVLLGAGLAMAMLAGRPLAIADAFARGMVAAMVAPICASMGFAAALKVTGCDRHLVHLLMAPLRRARRAVVPGGIGAAYLVNMAVPSQSSTAAALGPILVPLLVAAGLSPAEAGAALVLGSSFGGDLLNPGAQDLQIVAGATGLAARSLSVRVLPAGLAGAVVAILAFTLTRRPARPAAASASAAGAVPGGSPLDPVRAVIPLVPIGLLLLAYSGWGPMAWLLRPPAGPEWRALAGAVPVVRAMLIGTALAAIVGWREVGAVVRGHFDGMGRAYGEVISLTIAAQCFGAGLEAVGVGRTLLGWLGGSRWWLAGLSIGFPWGLAVLSGSGSGPVNAFATTFLKPLGAGPGTASLGALTCLAAACGRTMSPVSAVVIFGSGLVGVTPPTLIRLLLPALAAGMLASLATVFLVG